MKLTIDEKAINYIIAKAPEKTVSVGLFKPGSC